LPVGPRILVEWLVAELARDGPLIRFVDGCLRRFGKRSAGPAGRNAIEHLSGYCSLFLPCVRIDDPPCVASSSSSASSAATKTVDRPSIKRIQPYLSRARLQAGLIGCFFRRQDDFRGIEFRGVVETIFRRHTGKSPIHHSNAGWE